LLFSLFQSCQVQSFQGLSLAQCGLVHLWIFKNEEKRRTGRQQCGDKRVLNALRRVVAVVVERVPAKQELWWMLDDTLYGFDLGPAMA
jgi:hypothetical protein